MRSNFINSLPTSQGAVAHIFHNRHKQGAGTGSITTTIKLPKTMHVVEFPSETYYVSVL